MVDADKRELIAEKALVVEPADCASRWGNDGLEVLSTPAILGAMERLCAEALAPHLAADEMTVGVRVVMHHRAPATVGSAVTYRVRSSDVGRRTLFEFEVVDGSGTVLCLGSHLRAVVGESEFRRRLAAGAGAGPSREAR